MDHYAEISLDDLNTGLETLAEFAEGEFHADLDTVLDDENEALAFRRIGRLMALWVKFPFAESREYDPNHPWNWAKSYRSWGIREPRRLQAPLSAEEQIRVDLLGAVAAEWNRPIINLGEFNIFHWICYQLLPVICSESNDLAQTNETAERLREQGHSVTMFSLTGVFGSVSVTIAAQLVAAVPFLTTAHLPIVTGVTLLLVRIGHRKLCAYMSKFTDLKEPYEA